MNKMSERIFEFGPVNIEKSQKFILFEKYETNSRPIEKKQLSCNGIYLLFAHPYITLLHEN